LQQRFFIMVEFGDVEPHDNIAKKLSSDGCLELMNSPIKMRAKIAHPSDHGFVLYIGADTPSHIENFEKGKWNALGGTIRIPMTTGAE